MSWTGTRIVILSAIGPPRSGGPMESKDPYPTRTVRWPRFSRPVAQVFKRSLPSSHNGTMGGWILISKCNKSDFSGPVLNEVKLSLWQKQFSRVPQVRAVLWR